MYTLDFLEKSSAIPPPRLCFQTTFARPELFCLGTSPGVLLFVLNPEVALRRMAKLLSGASPRITRRNYSAGRKFEIRSTAHFEPVLDICHIGVGYTYEDALNVMDEVISDHEQEFLTLCRGGNSVVRGFHQFL